MAGTPRLYDKSVVDKNLELRLGPPWQRKSPEKGFSGLWSNEGQLLHYLDENNMISTAATLPRTTQKRYFLFPGSCLCALVLSFIHCVFRIRNGD